MITVQLMTPWNVRSFGKEGVEPASRWQPQTGHRSHAGARWSARRALLPGPPTLVRVLGSSRAGYFTLNLRHAVLAAVCAVVLAIVARMR